VTDSHPKTILVVEDESAVRRLIVQTLKQNGFAPLEAASAMEGLAAFETHAGDISLAIVDMVMPAMSGLDLAAELVRLQPDLKILYISGYGQSVAMISIQRQTPDLVLIKPFTVGVLLERVRKLLAAPGNIAPISTPTSE